MEMAMGHFNFSQDCSPIAKQLIPVFYIQEKLVDLQTLSIFMVNACVGNIESRQYKHKEWH
jgi:hypothetical protein